MILIQEALLRSFDIDEIVMIEPIDAGPRATIWQVQVKRGGKTHLWSIKSKRSSDTKRLDLEAEIAHRLKDQGFTLAPQVILTREKQSWFIFQNEYYCASDWIAADNSCSNWLGFSPFDENRSRLAACLLADFHCACSQIELSKAVAAAATAMIPPLSSYIPGAWQRSLLQAAARLPADDPLGAVLHGVQHKATATLAAIIGQAVTSSAQEQQLIHGDFHAGNVLYAHDRAVGLLDFEYLHRDFRLADVGYGAFMFSIGDAEDVDGMLACTKVADFAQSYNEQIAAKHPEIGTLEPKDSRRFAQLAAFVVSAWLVDQYIAKDQFRSFILPRLRKALNFALMPIDSDG